jgi:ribose transport system permease protein
MPRREEETVPSSYLSRAADVLRRLSVLVILAALCVFFAALSKNFITVANALTVALQTSIVALVAIGMTFALIGGGIDLSVGSVVALTGALSAGLAVRSGLGTYPAILIALAAGTSLGALSGALVVWGNVPPFIATLAMMAAARGLTLVYTQGRPIAGMDDAFKFWGTGTLGPVPMPVVVLAVVAVVGYFLLAHTRLGLHIYAVGGIEETARLAGIRTQWVKLTVYMVSGFTASVTGVLMTARLWSAQPNIGTGLELDAITAAVLGGTSLFGGVGGIGGTLVGAFIIGVLSNGLNLVSVPSYNQQVIKGLVFIVAVLLDFFLKRRR